MLVRRGGYLLGSWTLAKTAPTATPAPLPRAGSFIGASLLRPQVAVTVGRTRMRAAIDFRCADPGCVNLGPPQSVLV